MWLRNTSVLEIVFLMGQLKSSYLLNFKGVFSTRFSLYFIRTDTSYNPLIINSALNSFRVNVPAIRYSLKYKLSLLVYRKYFICPNEINKSVEQSGGTNHNFVPDCHFKPEVRDNEHRCFISMRSVSHTRSKLGLWIIG